MDSYFSKTIEKGLAILSLFDRDHSRFSLSEISQRLNLNKTSTYRFVNTLVELGYLKKHPKTKSIKIGHKALHLGYNFISSFDLLQTVKPLVDKVFIEHNVTIDSSMLKGASLLALYRREAPSTIFLRQPLMNDDLHARAMGKAVLAALNKNDLSEILTQLNMKKFTAFTVDSKKALIKDLENIRHRGYSINNEEYIMGYISIGAAIVNFESKFVMGAISFDFSKSERSLTSIEKQYAPVLTRLANEISELVTITEN